MIMEFYILLTYKGNIAYNMYDKGIAIHFVYFGRIITIQRIMNVRFQAWKKTDRKMK